MLTKLVYPSVLLGIGIVGNGVLLSAQISELKKEMKDEFKEVKAVVKDIKTEVKSLTARQTALELKDMEINQRMFRDCAEGRKRG